MSDRLTLTRALESSGMASDAAERIATEIYDAIHDNVATKADIAAIRADLAAVKADLERQIDRMVIRLGAIAVIVAGLLFAALQRWPPHG
jgi:2-phosphoglycerate kinase